MSDDNKPNARQQDGLQTLAGVVLDLCARVSEKRPGVAPHSARLAYWCARDDIPESTVRAAVAQGKGPRVYVVGRLQYVTAADWHAWHSRLAETGGFRLTSSLRGTDDVA